LAQGALAPTENARALGSPLTSDCKLLASSGRLIVNAIVLYNTIYTQRALDHLAAAGLRVDDVDIERLSPLGSDHLTLTGRYRITLTEALRDRSAYRELNAGPAVAA
jgi:Tn3 transposase DDE domain-containing protein